MVHNPSNTWVRQHNEILQDAYPRDNEIMIQQLSVDLVVK